MRQWWPVAFLFVFLALVGVFVFLVAMPHSDTSDTAPSGTHATAQPDSGDAASEEELATEAERFAEAIEIRQPKYTYTAWTCPVDEVELQVPGQSSQQSNNRFGGVATDLMSIALAPPSEGIGRPSLEMQDWEMLLVTCPECGATYHGIDLWNLQQDQGYSLENWDLAQLASALAARDFDTWTVEERVLARVLTQQAMGVEDVELGFTALQGAYAANFGTWYGNQVNIPSPAFYALTAAFFKRALENGQALNDQSRCITAMTQGEAYRLLARTDDAAAAFTAARESEALDEGRIQVLEQLEGLLNSGDHALAVAEVGADHVPPGGWYLSEMLPAINSHIAYNRGNWAEMDDADAIITAMIEMLP